MGESASDELVDDEDTFFAITGNFNSWEEDRLAPGDVPGQHTCTVAVPESGVIEFRFLREGSSDQVIAPATENCTRKTTPIVGPKAGLKNNWIISCTPESEVTIELLSLNGKYSVMWLECKESSGA